MIDLLPMTIPVVGGPGVPIILATTNANATELLAGMV
jgi:hypothetical protein